MVAYQDAPESLLTEGLREACARALHVIAADGRVHVGEEAVLYVYEQLGWTRSAAVLRSPPMAWVLPVAYRTVAANRPWFARFFFTSDPDHRS